MTRAELLASLNNTQGLDDNMYGYDSKTVFGADDVNAQANLSSLSITLTVANAASISLNLFKASDLAAAALPTNVASPAVSAYTDIIKYLVSNPGRLTGMLIQSSETTSSGAPVLASLQIQPSRQTPFGLTCSNALLVQQFLTPSDFQVNRVSVPLATDLDGFSFLNIVSGVNNSGATVTFTTTLFFGSRIEARKDIPRELPVVPLPNGQGFKRIGAAQGAVAPMARGPRRPLGR